MNHLNKILNSLSLLLIIVSVIFIFIDLKLLVAYWKDLSSYDSYKMVGSGVPQKNVLLFGAFRWFLLLIAGFGLMYKNVLGWIFPLAFLLVTFCGLTISFLSHYSIHEELFSIYFVGIIIILATIIFVFRFLNLDIVKQYLNINKYQKFWIWSSIFILNVIGILICRS